LFFKFKPSSQSTLEGSREFSAVLAVPSEWRAGVVVVSCQARGRQPRYLIPAAERSQHRTFLVALHQAGDDEARQAARRYLDAPALTQKAAAPVPSNRGSAASEPEEASGSMAFFKRLPFSKKP
jgi:hypothetical protein